MKQETKWYSKVFLVLVMIFFYAPIIYVVIFSF
ncbi:MAG: ABC transporter permease, partial [Erysipelotrichaceae bacterium]|nr:ABC transporter permease [Erysipelotrichaceae bacterium]